MPTITPELEADILERIARGETVRSIRALFRIGQADWIRHFVASNHEGYQRAREAKADALADEGLEIVDTDPDPQRARNRADYRKWYAGCLNRLIYGANVNVQVSGKIDVAGALADARARALPVCDQLSAIDAEVLDRPVIAPTPSADSVSVAQRAPLLELLS